MSYQGIGKCRHCGQQAFYDEVAGLGTLAAGRVWWQCQGRIFKSLGHSVRGF